MQKTGDTKDDKTAKTQDVRFVLLSIIFICNNYFIFMNKPIEWKSVKRKVLELKPYDKNPRDITEQGLSDLNKSISKFGLAEPIVISTENIIIGGHARWQTLKQLNVKECDCYLPNRKLTAKEIDELNIRLKVM